MSFRLFVYYCAVCGGWAAWLGWALGRLVPLESGVGLALVKGLILGLLVSLGLALVDAWGSLSGRQGGQTGLRIGVAVGVGCLGGLIGAGLGQHLTNLCERSTMLEAVVLVLGWVLTGLLIGVSVGAFDVLSRYVRAEPLGSALRKLVHGMVGGSVGGLLGSILYLVLRWALAAVLKKPAEELVSAGATGLVALGVCIGLFIGLAQVVLLEAWIRVEAGFRPGREVILAKAETTIGRGEGCDIALFGDNGVDKLHAKIVRQGELYVVVDAETAGGTFLNDVRVQQPQSLRSGDAIRVGKSLLRFGEREKQAASPTAPRSVKATSPERSLPPNPFDS